MTSLTSISGDNPDLWEILIEKHSKTLDILSAISIWKQELNFLKELVSQFSWKAKSTAGRKNLDHLLEFIAYYEEDILPELSKKLCGHEKKLSESLDDNKKFDVEYLKEHDGIMLEFDNLANKIFSSLLRHMTIRQENFKR